MESFTIPQSQPAIHPLFAKERFADGIDWEKGFRVAAVLATRLLDTPQALHWVYAFLWGVNQLAELPEGVECGDDANRIPRKYACNKGVGQLSAEDNTAARQHLIKLADNIQFAIKDFEKQGTNGLCQALTNDSMVNYTHGYASIISISGELYRSVLLRDTRDAEDAAALDFRLAMIMLHEVAHALGNANMGDHVVEDFFETSLVAENGFEFESRIFGMIPRINLKPEISYWHVWQNVDTLCYGYHLEKICRRAWKLPKSTKGFTMHPSFPLKLVGDAFWEEEYVQHGAVALIPPWVRYWCESDYENNYSRGIPQSIRDLFRENEKSYAQRKYARFANPGLIMRGGYPSTGQADSDSKGLLQGPERSEEKSGNDDEISEAEEEDDDEEDHTLKEILQEAEWLDGEGFEASEYNFRDEPDIKYFEGVFISKSELEFLHDEFQAVAPKLWEKANTEGLFGQMETEAVDSVMEESSEEEKTDAEEEASHSTTGEDAEMTDFEGFSDEDAEMTDIAGVED